MVFKRLILVAGLILAAPAFAQTDGAPARIAAMIACRAIAGDTARLACFDNAAASIDAAQAKGDLVVLDRKTVIARKQSRFGLPAAKTDLFGGGVADQATSFTQLDTTIRSARPAGSIGRWNVALADGSVWQTIDALPLPPKAGATIAVKQAPLGGYRATIARQRSVLVKRLR